MSKPKSSFNRLTQSPIIASIFISVLVATLLANQMYFGVISGLRLIGDHINSFIGLGGVLNISADLENPLIHRISLLTICFFLGALICALLARQFTLQLPSKLNLVFAMTGGILMGLGATIAGGCTIGGLYFPIVIGAPTGFVMFIGIILGAIVGYKWQLQLMMSVLWGRNQSNGFTPSKSKSRYLGLTMLVLLLLWAVIWYFSEQKSLSYRTLIIIGGFGLGAMMQRSRFCMSSAIRSPIIGGDHQMSIALAVLLILSTFFCGGVIHLFKLDVLSAVPATFWLGSLLGGVIFGVGMVFGGGCSTGSLWRAAEGNGKSIVTIIFMAWSCSIFSAIGNNFGVFTREITENWLERSMLGIQYFLNNNLNEFLLTNSLTITFILCWYLLIKLALAKKLYF